MTIISNNAAISANYRSTQFCYTNTINTKYVSNSSGNCGGVLNTTSIFASNNNDYTKKDAIMKQWNLKGSFNIYEEVSVDKLQHLTLVMKFCNNLKKSFKQMVFKKK